jgi:hypothetical protein
MKREPLEQTLSRYSAFWKRQPVDRPILGITLSTYTPLEMIDQDLLPQDSLITPADLNVDTFLDWYDQDCKNNLALGGDQFWVAVPFWGIPWMEAMMGCRVYRSGSSIWTEHHLESLRDFPEIDLSLNNPWLAKLLEFTSRLVDFTRGCFPVAPPLLRGPSDLLAALRGSQRFLLDLYDDPDEISRIAAILTDAWINIAKQIIELIPPYRGGYCNGNRQVWAPGTCIETQEDAAGMASPKFFRRFFLAGTKKIVSSFDHGWIHVHSSYSHNLDELLSVDEIAAIEFTIDTPPGPAPGELIPVIQKIQQHKPVILHGTLDLDEMKILVNNLSPRGLCIISRVDNAAEGNATLEELLTTLNKQNL